MPEVLKPRHRAYLLDDDDVVAAPNPEAAARFFRRLAGLGPEIAVGEATELPPTHRLDNGAGGRVSLGEALRELERRHGSVEPFLVASRFLS